MFTSDVFVESTDDDDDLIDVETLVTPHSDSTSAQSVDSEGSMSNPVGRARNHVPLKRIKLEKLLQVCCLSGRYSDARRWYQCRKYGVRSQERSN